MASSSEVASAPVIHQPQEVTAAGGVGGGGGRDKELTSALAGDIVVVLRFVVKVAALRGCATSMLRWRSRLCVMMFMMTIAPMPCTQPSTRHLYGIRKKAARTREKNEDDEAPVDESLEDAVRDMCRQQLHATCVDSL